MTKTHDTKREQVIKWLEINAKHIKLLEWGGSFSKKSQFFDKNTDKKFKYTFSKLKTKLKEYPNRKFGLDKKEQILLCKSICKNKYGVKEVATLSFVKEKRKQTNIKKYGVPYVSQNITVQENREKTFLKKYGVRHVLQNKDIIQKIDYNDIKQKTKETKIKNQQINIIDGKTLSEWAENKNLASYPTILRAFKIGLHPTETKPYSSILEIKIYKFLKNYKVDFIYNKKLPQHKDLKKSFLRPDFLIPQYNLIIECDGELYHKDITKDETRNKEYKKHGYNLLILSGKEIVNNWEFVENRLKKYVGLQ